MKFNVYVTLRGPAATVEAPSRDNPVECVNLDYLLKELAGRLPFNLSLGLETVGVRVELAEDKTGTSPG